MSSSTCTDCDEVASRLVVIRQKTRTKPVVLRTCTRHAAQYRGDTDAHQVLVRLLTLTTSAMPAMVRTKHTIAALNSNGFRVGPEGGLRSIHSQMDGPTTVKLELPIKDRVIEVLKFQGWDVFEPPEDIEELVVEHPRPVVAPEEITPGLLSAMRLVRVDEIDKILVMLDGDIEFWRSVTHDNEVFDALVRLRQEITFHRDELGGTTS